MKSIRVDEFDAVTWPSLARVELISSAGTDHATRVFFGGDKQYVCRKNVCSASIVCDLSDVRTAYECYAPEAMHRHYAAATPVSASPEDFSRVKFA